MQLIVQIIAAAAFKITLNKVAGFLFIYYVPPGRKAFGQLILSFIFVLCHILSCCAALYNAGKGLPPFSKMVEISREIVLIGEYISKVPP